MEENEPLLEGSPSLSQLNLVTTLRGDFVSKLPERVLSGLDPSSPHHFDISKATGLTEGEKLYYKEQFGILESFEEVELQSQNAQQAGANRNEHSNERAIQLSNCTNIILLAFKIYATVRCGCLAIAASTLDSILDLLAGGILWFTHLTMKSKNIYKYPIGKLRVQPVGILIFASVMATLGLGVVFQAVEQLIEDEPLDRMTSEQLTWLYTIMLTATGLKLILWIYCRSFRSEIIRAYAKDHLFDVVTNVVGLTAAILGDKIYWWIDPTGAIVLSIYTIANWSNTALENAVSLIGLSAPPDVLQKLTYLVLTHHPAIKRVKTIRAYTLGVHYFVEVDIELPEDHQLKEAHAIGESLQIKIEELPEVERAFVRLEHECEHRPKHVMLI